MPYSAMLGRLSRSSTPRREAWNRSLCQKTQRNARTHATRKKGKTIYGTQAQKDKRNARTQREKKEKERIWNTGPEIQTHTTHATQKTNAEKENYCGKPPAIRTRKQKKKRNAISTYRKKKRLAHKQNPDNLGTAPRRSTTP